MTNTAEVFQFPVAPQETKRVADTDDGYGNMTEIGRLINTTRNTVRKYVHDVKAENHVVINGRLMTKHKGAKVIE